MTNDKNNFLATVLIPLAGNLEYFDETIDSILVQTNERFQVLMVNDGISERAHEWLIKKISNLNHFQIISSNGKGISQALNFGITEISTKYIIRMDSDDLMHFERIQKQIDFMEKNQQIDISGTQIQLFTAETQLHASNYPTKHPIIQKELKFQNCLAHPTVIFRNKSIQNIELYDSFYDGMEDYELWRRLCRNGLKFANMDSILLQYRIHRKQSSQEKSQKVSKLLMIMKMEEMVGKNNRGEKVFDLDAYIDSLLVSIKLRSQKDFTSFNRSVVLHKFIEGGLRPFSLQFKNKFKLVWRLALSSPKDFIYVIQFVLWKMISRTYRFLLKCLVKFINYGRYVFTSRYFRLLDFIKKSVLHVTRILLLNYEVRRLLPQRFLKFIIGQLATKTLSWRWVESEDSDYLACFDGKDWIFLWENGGLVWHEFLRDPIAKFNSIQYELSDDQFFRDLSSMMVFTSINGEFPSVLVKNSGITKPITIVEKNPDHIRRFLKTIKYLNLKKIKILPEII